MKESMDIECGTRYARDLWTGEDSGWGRDDVEHDLKIEAARALRRILCVQVRFLGRITAPIAGVGDVTLSYVCPHCHCFPLEDYIWWVSSQHGEGNNRTKKQCKWWCAACGGQHDWSAPNGVLVIQDSTDSRDAIVFSSSCGTAGYLRKPDQCAEALDKPAE